MKKSLKKLFRNEKGSYAIIAIIMIPIFMLLAALAVDMSILFATRVELLKASDIAAIEVSKYLEIIRSEKTGEAVIKPGYVTHAYKWVNYNFGNRFGGILKEVGVRFEFDNDEVNPEIVYVKSVVNIPLHFAKIIGMKSTDISVEGSARIREVK